jgi:hypothetical protein
MDGMMIDYLLVALMFLVGLGPMIMEIHAGRYDFFNPKNPFVLYYLLQLTLSGLIVVVTKEISVLGPDPNYYQDTYTWALFLSLCGLCAFQIGYYATQDRPWKVPSLLQRKWHPVNALWVSGGLAVLGIVAFFALMEINGGLGSFLEDREYWRQFGLVGQGFLIFPATALMALGGLIYLIVNISRSTRVWTVIKCAAIFGALLIPASMLGFRSFLVLPILQFVVVLNYTYKRLSLGMITVVMIGVIVVFTLYGLIRTIPYGQEVTTEAIATAAAEQPELAYGVVFRSMGTEVVAAVMTKLEETGDYELGWRSALEALTIAIPSTLWEDKPQPASARFTTYFFGADLDFRRGYFRELWGGMSPTAVGELFWHFGWLGVIVGLFCLGWLCKRIYATFEANRTNRSMLLIYAILYTTIAMFAEAIQGYFNALVMYAIVLFVLVHVLSPSWAQRSAHRSQLARSDPRHA